MNNNKALWILGGVVVSLVLLLQGGAAVLAISDRWATKTELAATKIEVTAATVRLEKRLDDIAADVRALREALAPVRPVSREHGR